MGTAIFFLTIVMAGREPVHFEHETKTMAECLYEVHEFLARPSHEVLIKGGQVQVGCARDLPKSVEH